MKVQKEMDVEVLSMEPLERRASRRARSREALIVGDGYERREALFDPQEAKNCVDNPGVFEGYE